MSLDTKTVEMRFDNSNFESNVKQSMSTLDKLKSALKLDGASKGLGEIERASKKLNFSEMDGALHTVGKTFSWLEQIGIGALRRIGEQAADAGMKLVKSLTIDQLTDGWSKYEQKTTSVQTIMANLRDETGRFIDEASKMEFVNGEIEKLNWFSDETSYSLTDMTDNIGKFVANGQGLEDSVVAMEGIATWAAISGQNSTTAARAMYNISQAMGTGSMRMMDWKSIENANMATAEFKKTAIAIAEQRGKIGKGQVTIENFRDSLSKGWFDKDVMMGTFKEYGSAIEKVQKKIQDYADANDGRTLTASKALKMLAASDDEFAKSLGYRAFKAAQEAKTLTEAINATSDAVSTKWTQIYEDIFGNYLEQREMWTDLANAMWDVFAGPLDDLKVVFDFWNKGIDGISGRTHIIEGFSNVFNTLIHSVRDDETGEITKYSIFDTIKNGFKEVFGLDKEADELSKSLWNLTKRFKEFTESLIPSDATLAKIKNSFKGLFTIFKIGGKTVKAIIKPFKDLFNKTFKNGLSSILDITDGFGNMIQRFDKFLDDNKVFESISDGISWGLGKIGEGLDIVSNALAGVSFTDFVSNLKNKVLNFFNKFDFKKGFGQIGTFFSGVIEQIKAVKTETLPEKLTPLQNFYVGVKRVFKGIQTFFQAISPSFRSIGEWINNAFSSIGEAFKNNQLKAGFSRFTPIWEGIKGIFKGVGNFFESLGPTFKKIGNWFGDGLSKVGEGLAKLVENKSAAEIVQSIVKGGFFISLTNFINSLAGLNFGRKKILKSIAEDLGEIGGVLKAYKREINASALVDVSLSIGALCGSMWLLSQIPTEKITTAGKALAQIALVIAGFSVLDTVSKIVTNLAQKNGGAGGGGFFGQIRSIFTGMVQASIFANDASAKFLKAGAAIALIAVGFKTFSKSLKIFADGVSALGQQSSSDDFKNGLKALGYITAGIAVLSLFSGIGNRRPASSLFAVLSFILLVKTVSSLVDTISSMGQNTNFTFFKSGLYMFSLIAGVATIFTTINSIGGKGKIASALGFFVSMIAVVLVINKITNVLLKLGKEVDSHKLKNAGDIVSHIASTILIWMAAFALIEKLGKRRGSVAIAAAAVLAAAAAVWLIGDALAKVANSGTKEKISAAGSALKGISTAMGIIIGILGLVSGLNFKFGKLGFPISGAFFGSLGVPLGAISFLIACAGVWVMGKALEALGDENMNFEGVAHLKSMNTQVAIITGILGAVTGLTISGTAGVFNFKYFGPVGVPLGAASFLIACAGVWVMANALSVLSEAPPIDTGNLDALKSMSKTVAWIVGLLGLVAGLNIAGIAGPVAFGIFGSFGVPVGAISFAIACAGVWIMASALSQLADVDVATLPVAEENLKQIIKTVTIVVGLLGLLGGFFGLGMLIGAVSFDIVVLGIRELVKGLDEFAHVDLSNLEKNCRAVADALAAFFEQAGNVVEKAVELASSAAPAAAKLGLALVVLGAGIAVVGEGLNVMGAGLVALGAGAIVAAAGLDTAADSFLNLKNKDLSGIAGNILKMVAAMIGISAAGLVAAPGLLAIGVAAETILNPIAKAAGAITDLIEAIHNLEGSGGSGGGGPKAGITVGSFVPGWAGRIVRGAEYVVDLFKNRKEQTKQEAETFVPEVIDSLDSGADKAAPKAVETGKKIDNSLSEGISSNTSSTEAAMNKINDLYTNVLGNNGVLDQFKNSGLLGMLNYGEGMTSLNLGQYGDMTLGQLMTSLQNGGEQMGPMGKLLASTLGDNFSGFDFGSSAQVGLDQIVSTLSGGTIDVAQAGDLLTQTFGDKWKEFDWQKMTFNDVMSIISQGILDGSSVVEASGSATAEAGATAMEKPELYGAAAGKNTLGYAARIMDSKNFVLKASSTVADASVQPLQSVDTYTWGTHVGQQFAAGINASVGAVRAAASAMAAAVRSVVGFSEPEEGPLSDFHTYAPDMIKLWCKGIYDNLGQVEDSTDSMAGTIYDGFSAALDYVSDLIDNGMSDELAIRPVMDLSGIQNGIRNLDSMVGGANGYTISGSTRLASSTAYGMGARFSTTSSQPSVVSGSGVNNYNTFNITNDDPQAVAQKVSRILDQGTRREQAIWAR